MAEATVTIKLSPKEFDLLRRAMADSDFRNSEIANDKSVSPEVRRAAREEQAQLKLLTDRFK